MSIKKGHNLSFRKLMILLVSLVSMATLSGCMKSSAATQVSYQTDIEVTEAMLKVVNATFRSTMVGGDWRYQGAQAVNGTINAYIQIPEKLNMSKSHQENYLKMSLCPSSNRPMWRQIKGIPLSVHVYTMNKKHTVFANCQNPVA